jgi:glycosyltransferase involved in cell wall biosynthesis
MNSNHYPKVSVGCPVYNGEKYLMEALNAIVHQTFQDYEVIICDNASTDNTGRICKRFTKQDARFKYYRNKKNYGASINFNRAFSYSRGRYFKWMSHDDIHKPDFLSKCVDLLDHNPSVVLAYAKAVTIDQYGRGISKEWGAKTGLSSDIPHKRYKESLAPPVDPIPLPIFGVIRSSILEKTKLFGSYPDCDRALLAELSLYGRFYEIPEALFLHREHKNRAGPNLSKDPYWAVTFWTKGNKDKLLLPHWNLFASYLYAISNAPLGLQEKTKCYSCMGSWFKRHKHVLLRDLIVFSENLPLIGNAIKQNHKRFSEYKWKNRVKKSIRKIDSKTTKNAIVILVDDAAFGTVEIPGKLTLPFIEKEGKYWGAPPDDASAIQELERLRLKGAVYIVFAWPSFWWLSYYLEFKEYIEKKFTCIAEDNDIIVYEREK